MLLGSDEADAAAVKMLRFALFPLDGGGERDEGALHRTACAVLRDACAAALARMPTSEAQDREALGTLSLRYGRTAFALYYRIVQKGQLSRTAHALGALLDGGFGAERGRNRAELRAELQEALRGVRHGCDSVNLTLISDS